MNSLGSRFVSRSLKKFFLRPLNTSSRNGIRNKTKINEQQQNGERYSRPFVEEIEEFAQVGWGSLVKPTIFTVALSGSAFGLAAIWQYENMRAKLVLQRSKNSIKSIWSSIIQDRNEEVILPQNKASEFRTALNKWWNESLTDGQRVFVPICAANVLVFCLWRVPGLRPMMKKYFLSNPAAPNNCWPMLFSAFSHFSLFHLAANMFVLHSFSSSIVALLGKEQFVALYFSSAVFSAYCSHAFKILSGRMGMSLGASGAICTVLGVFGTLVPDATMQIVFLPFFQFSAATAIKGLIAIDTAGLIARWHFFDHAAHLGGMLLGIWYCQQGYNLIWEKREPLMTWWHQNVRNRPKPSP